MDAPSRRDSHISATRGSGQQQEAGLSNNPTSQTSSRQTRSVMRQAAAVDGLGSPSFYQVVALLDGSEGDDEDDIQVVAQRPPSAAVTAMASPTAAEDAAAHQHHVPSMQSLTASAMGPKSAQAAAAAAPGAAHEASCGPAPPAAAAATTTAPANADDPSVSVTRTTPTATAHAQAAASGPRQPDGSGSVEDDVDLPLDYQPGHAPVRSRLWRRTRTCIVISSDDDEDAGHTDHVHTPQEQQQQQQAEIEVVLDDEGEVYYTPPATPLRPAGAGTVPTPPAVTPPSVRARMSAGGHKLRAIQVGSSRQQEHTHHGDVTHG